MKNINNSSVGYNFNQQELEKLKSEFKDTPTSIKVVFVKICDKTIIERQDYSFVSEDDARYFAEDIARIEVGISLDLWKSCYKSIANIYTFTDHEEIIPVKYRILIYPVER